MTDTPRTVRDHAFEPLECSIPDELTIAEYRNRRNGQVPSGRNDRRAYRRRSARIERRRIRDAALGSLLIRASGRRNAR